MTGKTIDIFQRQSRAAQNASNCWRDMLLRERRNFPVEYDAEALRIDSPPHDVEGVRPGVLAAHLNSGNTAIVGPEHASSRAIAEDAFGLIPRIFRYRLGRRECIGRSGARWRRGGFQ